MKELQRGRLPDGSLDFGNGIIGPSLPDVERANLTFAHEKPKKKEVALNNLLLISRDSLVGKFLQTSSKIRIPAKFAIPVGLAVTFLATACGSENSDPVVAGSKDRIAPISGQITSSEGKISISKKPEELFKALLTSPIAPNILPQGMISRGISAGEIDATGKALKEIGAVNITIEDSASASTDS